MNFLTALRYSFAVQLLIVHGKKNLSLLAFWGLLFGLTTSSVGLSYGAPYTLLDPEYMGRVGFWSFWWVGVAFGFFVTAWQLSCYMLNSFRFPFLATSKRPFLHFCINNSVIPLTFLVTYIICLARFQLDNEFTPGWRIPIYIAGLLGGIVFICSLFGIYFYYTNRNIHTVMADRHATYLAAHPDSESSKKKSAFIDNILSHIPFLGLRNALKGLFRQRATNRFLGSYANNDIIRDTPDWEQPYRNPKIERVDYYLNARFRIRPTRGTEHYTEAALNAIFQQHHSNALLVQVVALCLAMFLGFATDIPFFQLPAIASSLLILVIIVSLMGAFTYWLTGWRSIGAITVLLILNQSSEFDVLNYNTPAYGLNYHVQPAAYSDTLIKYPINDAQVAADMAYMLPILENWKQKAQKAQGLCSDEKPNMLLLNFSGGGSRAMLWSLVATQALDSLLDGKLLDNTFLLAGASGGMLGAAYLRELYYQQHNLGGAAAIDNAAKDFLNPVLFTAATNDLFYPFRQFETGGHSYQRNRAYTFERQYHLNTDSIIANKTIIDYQIPEQQAQIPLLIITPTIVSNGKKLIISPHPVSYLCRPTNAHRFSSTSVETDGIELSFLSAQDGYQMLLSSAIRMNATYPFILPDTYLPTDPPMQVMDAGFRDNHGFETTFRMLLTFNEWIVQNTDEVVMLFIRSDQKDEAQNYPKQTYLERHLKPIKAFITTDMQDYQIDFAAATVDAVLKGKLTVLNLEYVPTGNNERASMSLHLTKKEKKDIQKAIYMPSNRQNIQQLSKLMNQ